MSDNREEYTGDTVPERKVKKRRRKQTCTTCDPTLHAQAKKAKLSLSKCLDDGIKMNLNRHQRKETLIKKLEYHQAEMDSVMNELNTLDELDKEINEALWEEAIQRMRSRFIANQHIEEDAKLLWANKLGVTMAELETVLEKEVY